MSESFPHLRFQRESPVTEKRSGRYRPSKKIDDPADHGRSLQQRLENAKTEADLDEGGFDDRRLFRFTVEKGFSPEDLRKISANIEFVSQENEEVVVAFVSAAALEVFEARLATLASGGKVKYKDVLYAMQSVDGWRAEDRVGWALKQEDFPEKAPFTLDIELWPLEDHSDERTRLWRSFESWLAEVAIDAMDSVKQPGLTLYRVRCDHAQARRLLRHRDVRTVDLPPRHGLELKLIYTDIQDLPKTPSPPDNAPGIVVLDSGLTTGHPLIAPAVGDAQSFLPGKDASDENGHGTHVAGLALYGDVEAAATEGRFVPDLRLFSGRILDENNENASRFVENQIDEATRYFHEEYGCVVFNLSFGDRNKPYLGGHVKWLAYTLDALSRELGVLFLVPTGNVDGSCLEGLEWKEAYPTYLTKEQWAIIDPAPALNALTVGSLVRHDQTLGSQRYAGDPAEVPIARKDQPSPFSRCGPSVGGAIKPELIAYGGNWALNARSEANLIVESGLGELSFRHDYIGESLFAVKSGSSAAAPQVSHLAALVLSEYPDASPDLLRALLLAHASVPEASLTLFGANTEALRRCCGYGQVDNRALMRSLENDASLIAEAKIANKRHHFYEIPLPPVFVSPGRRSRELSAALAFTPHVRSTRVAYKATRIDFRVVAESNLQRVTTMFNRSTEKQDYESIPELKKPNVSLSLRGRGTAQAATWSFSQFNSRSVLRNKKAFVVVTRNDYPWGEAYSNTEESYALVVCLRDRQNEHARLYSEIRTRLQARSKARIRV